MLDLDPRIDFDEIVAAHLVNQKLCSSGIPVVNAPGQLNGIGQDRLANFLGEMSRGCNFDNLLMTTLDRAITFEQMNGVPSSIGEKLNFDVTGSLEETFDEDCTIAESGLCLTDGTFEGIFEVRLVTDHSHTSPATAHCGLDDN